MADSLFRNTRAGREPLAPSSEVGEHVHYEPTRRVGIGAITSHRPGHRPLTFLEYMALRSGMTLAEVTKLQQEGKLQ